MSFGERLKKCRIEKGYTQKQLASILDIDHTTLSKWESNTYEPDIKNIIQLSISLGVTTDYLFECTSKEMKNALVVEGAVETLSKNEGISLLTYLKQYRDFKKTISYTKETYE